MRTKAWMVHLVFPALALAIMLTGCAQLPGGAPKANPIARPVRTAITAFAFSGRIAVHQDQRRDVASISWRHAPQSDEILLATPLGQGIAELTRDAAGARLVTAERREYSAPDWQTLSTRVFGFALPLASLPRWLVADVPAEALGVSYDGAGRARRMVAADWQVAYLDYESEAADALPVLIELKHEDIEVRLKIDEWKLGTNDQ